MDLRTFPEIKNINQEELLSQWWYQPYIFADDIVSGAAPRFFIKGFDPTIIKRDQYPKQFDRFWKLSNQTARMYQDWAFALRDISGVDLKRSTVFEFGCNTGYLLYWLKQQSAMSCTGIDKADLTRQHNILGQITGVNDIDFRMEGWSSLTHSIQGLNPEEQFDLVICTAVAQHISDPLHLIKALSDRTEKALLFHTSVGRFNWGRGIRYTPAEHHKKWGDEFPNNMDTRVSRELLIWSLKECGFKKITQLKHSRDWLPKSWYNQFSALVCLK